MRLLASAMANARSEDIVRKGLIRPEWLSKSDLSRVCVQS